MYRKLNILIATIDNRIMNLKNIICNDNNILFTISHQISNFFQLKEKTNCYISKLKKRDNIIYTQIKGKGVAINRNNALKYRVKDSICLLSDDDVEYFQEGFDNILKEFNENSEMDFLTFKIKTFSGKNYKNYKNYSFKHNIKTLSNIGIIDVAFKEEIVDKLNLSFAERFGPGGEYPIGEDFIFMTDALKKGANIFFKPLDIVKHDEFGTGQKLDSKIIWGRGAMFARVFGLKAFIIDIYFSVKHFKEYKDKYTFFRYLNLLFKGSIDYLKDKGGQYTSNAHA